MHHPKGVIVIAALFAIAAIYLCAIATVLLISPGAISLMAARHLLYGLELAGPYMMLIGAAVYAVVAWGMFRMHNWARWIAMLIMVISIMPLVPKISMTELGVPVLWYGLQIALRVAIGWYLAQAPSVIDAFAAKAKPRISTDLRG
jgi:hypothetical protein